MKNSFDTALEAPTGKENVAAASKVDDVVPTAPESTLSDLDHSKLAEKALELADSASNSDGVTSTGAELLVPLDQPDATLPKDTPIGGGVVEILDTASDESQNGKPEEKKEESEPSAKADSSASPSASVLSVVPEASEAVVSDPLASAAAVDPSLKLEPASKPEEEAAKLAAATVLRGTAQDSKITVL